MHKAHFKIVKIRSIGRAQYIIWFFYGFNRYLHRRSNSRKTSSAENGYKNGIGHHQLLKVPTCALDSNWTWAKVYNLHNSHFYFRIFPDSNGNKKKLPAVISIKYLRVGLLLRGSGNWPHTSCYFKLGLEFFFDNLFV